MKRLEILSGGVFVMKNRVGKVDRHGN
jgi:hypothetical protein